MDCCCRDARLVWGRVHARRSKVKVKETRTNGRLGRDMGPCVHNKMAVVLLRSKNTNGEVKRRHEARRQRMTRMRKSAPVKEEQGRNLPQVCSSHGNEYFPSRPGSREQRSWVHVVVTSRSPLPFHSW
jgi:hypothetical protein